MALGVSVAYNTEKYSFSGGLAYGNKDVSGRAGIGMKMDLFSSRNKEKSVAQSDSKYKLEQKKSPLYISKRKFQDKQLIIKLSQVIEENKDLKSNQKRLNERIDSLVEKNSRLSTQLDLIYEWIQSEKKRKYE